MGVKIITFHTPKNYGAVLQAFSLLKYIEQFTEDVKIIDYDTKHLRSLYPILPKVYNLRSFVKYLLILPSYKARKIKYEKFEKFIQEDFKLTRKFSSISELFNYNWNNDLFITGSDQVFNPTRIEEERKVFYLDFLPTSLKKVSYAGSFGVDKIQVDKQEEIKNYLNKFYKLSVRERKGKEIVEKLIDKKVEVVLDPVFLNDKKFWEKNEKAYGKEFGNYLFYYRLINDKKSDEFVEKLAKEKGLKLVVLKDGYQRVKADYIVEDVGPKEFLYLMSHASFIATNAFHGVAFSIILEKQFVFTDCDKIRNQRGISILSLLNIEKEAYIETFDIKKTILYSRIKPILDKEIENSKNYLKCLLKEANS